ncbi:hypothetical protein BGX21_007182, partial [Mortierella sp. AD011]
NGKKRARDTPEICQDTYDLAHDIYHEVDDNVESTDLRLIRSDTGESSMHPIRYKCPSCGQTDHRGRNSEICPNNLRAITERFQAAQIVHEIFQQRNRVDREIEEETNDLTHNIHRETRDKVGDTTTELSPEVDPAFLTTNPSYTQDEFL